MPAIQLAECALVTGLRDAPHQLAIQCFSVQLQNRHGKIPKRLLRRN
jgi:hypothetical protein